MTDHDTPDRPEIPDTGTCDLIPRFKVTREQEGGFVAIPLYEVTPELADYGCWPVVYSRSFRELEVKCCAERLKVSYVEAAKAHVSAILLESDREVIAQIAEERSKRTRRGPYGPNGSGR